MARPTLSALFGHPPAACMVAHMAKRRGVGDDVNKFVSDIVSPWLGSGPRTPPQVQRGQQLARTLVEQADQFGTGGLGRAAMAGPTQLAKQAAFNAAAAGISYGIVRGAVAAGVKSGVAGRIQNALRNERVMVHGTASPIKGGYVNPQIGSAARPTENVVYGWNPRHQGGNWIPNTVAEYAHKAPEGVVPNPRVLVTKVPKRGSVVDPKNPGVVVSTKPARIVGEVPAKSIDTNYYEALNRELRKAGAPINNALKENKAVQKAQEEYRRWLLRRSERNSTA